MITYHLVAGLPTCYILDNENDPAPIPECHTTTVPLRRSLRLRYHRIQSQPRSSPITPSCACPEPCPHHNGTLSFLRCMATSLHEERIHIALIDTLRRIHQHPDLSEYQVDDEQLEDLVVGTVRQPTVRETLVWLMEDGWNLRGEVWRWR